MQEFIIFCNSLSGTERIYMICLLVGIAVPALNLVLGIFGDIGDIAAHFDLVDIDANLHTDHGDVHTNINIYAWLPLSPLCWSMFLIGFGSAGLITFTKMGMSKSICVAVLVGYLMMVAINKFVMQPLRRNNPIVLTQENLIGATAKVNETIRKGSIGSIFVVKNGVTLEYSAKSQDEEFSSKSEVIIKGFNDAVAIVGPIK